MRWCSGRVLTIKIIETLTSFPRCVYLVGGAEDMRQLVDEHQKIIIRAVNFLRGVSAEEDAVNMVWIIDIRLSDEGFSYQVLKISGGTLFRMKAKLLCETVVDIHAVFERTISDHDILNGVIGVKTLVADITGVFKDHGNSFFFHQRLISFLCGIGCFIH